MRMFMAVSLVGLLVTSFLLSGCAASHRYGADCGLPDGQWCGLFGGGPTPGAPGAETYVGGNIPAVLPPLFADEPVSLPASLPSLTPRFVPSQPVNCITTTIRPSVQTTTCQ
jgi:hypothetical protein